MNARIKRTVIALARENPTEEICGFIYCTETEAHVLPCRNISPEPTEAFEIDPQDYIKARGLGRLYGVYHSHTNGSTAFSPDDLDTAEELGLPFYVCTAVGGWASYVPASYTVPLTGASFAWGHADCLETVRTYYRQELGIHLTDYDRDETFATAAPNAILDHVEAEGFINLGGDIALAREHDVLLMRSDGRAYPHHLGVCVGHSRLLHHPRGRLSRIDDIDSRIIASVVGVLRYTAPVTTVAAALEAIAV